MNKNTHLSQYRPLTTALGLAMGAAISLGLARFSYALFLPLMREDLHWSYLAAGAMNTANASGYFLGALLCPWLFKKISAAKAFVYASLLTSLALGLSGLGTGILEFFSLRLLAGIFSAFVFVGGGILAARLGSQHPTKSGLLLGIYYGGTGIGIVVSSLIIPLAVDLANQSGWTHAWQLGWWVLAVVGCLLTFISARPSLSIPLVPSKQNSGEATSTSSYATIIFAYGCFGMGYIGYMTFVVALLRQLGMSSGSINLFYSILGLCVIASSRIWAKMLDTYKGGRSLGTLNLLLAIASFVPAIIALCLNPSEELGALSIVAIYFSGIIFGSCFLSAVASTTAFVRHNLPQTQWVSGITIFTITFAVGQVVGPTLTGWISDHFGGLAIGLLLSGGILLLGAIAAFYQRPLKQVSHHP